MSICGSCHLNLPLELWLTRSHCTKLHLQFAANHSLLCCRSAIAQAEIQRVLDCGGWVSRDGRVCDVLAVSRAFGDWEFKGKGLSTLLQAGVEEEWWDQEWADSVCFTADPVIATPTVTQTEISAEAGDEFLVVASDGLWYALTGSIEWHCTMPS